MTSGAQVANQVTVTTLEVAEVRRVGLHLRAIGSHLATGHLFGPMKQQLGDRPIPQCWEEVGLTLPE